MFSASPFAATPFSATGGPVIYSAAVAETATVLESLGVTATYTTGVADSISAAVAMERYVGILAEMAEGSSVFDAFGAQPQYSGAVAEGAMAADVVGSAANLLAVLGVTASGTDLVSRTVGFNSVVAETAQASVSTVSQATLNATATSQVSITEAPSVRPSTFSAALQDNMALADSLLATTRTPVTISESAVAVDGLAGRPLWEIINDSQTTSWAVIPTQP